MATVMATRPGIGAERLFYGGMGLVILLLVVAGFAPSYYLRGLIDAGRPLAPMTPLVHLHGLVFSAWILLFVMQTSLIAGRRHAWHRRLGMLGMALAAAVVVVGVVTAVRQVELASGPPVLDPLTWFAVPFFSSMGFMVLVGAGLLLRGSPQAHKRLMLLGTIGMLQAAVGRMPFPQTPLGFELGVLVAFSLVVPVLLWDLSQRRSLHRATLVGVGVLAAEQLTRMTVWQTEGWRDVAAVIVRVIG